MTNEPNSTSKESNDFKSLFEGLDDNHESQDEDDNPEPFQVEGGIDAFSAVLGEMTGYKQYQGDEEAISFVSELYSKKESRAQILEQLAKLYGPAPPWRPKELPSSTLYIHGWYLLIDAVISSEEKLRNSGSFGRALQGQSSSFLSGVALQKQVAAALIASRKAIEAAEVSQGPIMRKQMRDHARFIQMERLEELLTARRPIWSSRPTNNPIKSFFRLIRSFLRLIRSFFRLIRNFLEKVKNLLRNQPPE